MAQSRLTRDTLARDWASPPPPITNGVVPRNVATADTGAGLVDPTQDPFLLTGPRLYGTTMGTHTQPGLRPPGFGLVSNHPLGASHTATSNHPLGTSQTATSYWLRPPDFAPPPRLMPPGQAPENHSPSDCGMSCTHGTYTVVYRTILRATICTMSCALDAQKFFPRRTLKHNQPPHMGLSSAAPCQIAWPFSVTLRLSSVHQKATWAKRRCAQETTPPPSASRTHEPTNNPLFRRFLETPSRPVLSTNTLHIQV